MPTPDAIETSDTWEVSRYIKVPELSNAATGVVEDAVGAIAGVRQVTSDLDKHQVVVRYDASQSSYQDILQVLRSAGLSPADGWWDRMKGGWYQYTDENARENAKAPPPSCCNKPPR